LGGGESVDQKRGDGLRRRARGALIREGKSDEKKKKKESEGKIHPTEVVTTEVEISSDGSTNIRGQNAGQVNGPRSSKGVSMCCERDSVGWGTTESTRGGSV